MMPFPDLLRTYLQNAGMTVSALAREAGLPRRTIANWLEGYAQKPRHWRDLLRIAGALRLDTLATDDLLVSAGFPVTAMLRGQHPTDALLRPPTVDMANQVGQHIIEIIGESNGALFQDLPFSKAVYLMEQTVHLADLIGDRQRLCALTLELARCQMALARYDQAAVSLRRVIDLSERLDQPETRIEGQCLLLTTLLYGQSSDQVEALRLRVGLQAILAVPKSVPHSLRLRLIHALGLWAGSVQRLDEAAFYYEQLYQLSGPEHDYHRLLALNNLGDLAIQQRVYEQAQRLLAQAVTEAAPMHPALSYIHGNLGVTEMRCGNYGKAQQHLTTALTVAGTVEDTRAQFTLWLYQSELALCRRDFAAAADALHSVLALCRENMYSASIPALEYCRDRLIRGQGATLISDPCYRDLLER